jgi:hypothetical protein
MRISLATLCMLLICSYLTSALEKTAAKSMPASGMALINLQELKTLYEQQQAEKNGMLNLAKGIVQLPMIRFCLLIWH